MVEELTIGEKLYLLDPNVKSNVLIWKTLFELHIKGNIIINENGVQIVNDHKIERKFEKVLLEPFTKKTNFLFLSEYSQALKHTIQRFRLFKKILLSNSWRLATLFIQSEGLARLLYRNELTENGKIVRQKLVNHLQKIQEGLAYFDELNESEKKYLKNSKSDLLLLETDIIRLDLDSLEYLFSHFEIDLLINKIPDFLSIEKIRDDANGDFIDFVDSEGDTDGDSGGDGDGE